MAGMRFDIEKFNGRNDFGLWQVKVKALLVQQGLSCALKGSKGFPVKMEETVREELMEKAHSAIILSLGDKVLREVLKETTAEALWNKLEELYKKKIMVNRLYIKQKLYSFKIQEGKPMDDQLEEFNKHIDDLEGIEAKIDDEDKAIILLNALPKCFEHLKDAMLYGRKSKISLAEVQTALRAKEMQNEADSRSDTQTAPIVVGINQFETQNLTTNKLKTINGIENQHKDYVVRSCDLRPRSSKRILLLSRINVTETYTHALTACNTKPEIEFKMN